MKLLVTLLMATLVSSSIGCSWGRGCGCGTSYYGGSNCPGGNCGVSQGAYYQGYGGLQSASIPGAIPQTAAAPVIYGPVTTTASAPILVNQTASAAPITTYGN